MDLKAYYRKIRDIEADICTAFIVVVSEETNDGGKAGEKNEVRRSLGARMVAEGKARLASDEEAAAYYSDEKQRIIDAEEEAIRSKVQIAFVPEEQVRALKTAVKQRKIRDQE
jgi:hypothetical protein